MQQDRDHHVPLNDLLAFVENAVSGYPEQIEWFESDDDLEAWVRGDKEVTPTRIVVNTLRIPADIVELYPSRALWDGCQEIAARHGCELHSDGHALRIAKLPGHNTSERST